ERNDVIHVAKHERGFAVTLSNGEHFIASRVIAATGLSYFLHIPRVFSCLPSSLTTHTSGITRFAAFEGRDVAVIGSGQSALEAAALLNEFGARPQLLARDESILWQTQVSQTRSLWRRIRSPISGLGAGPKAWALTNFPGAMHSAPEK